MSKKVIFQGSGVALITPFTEDLSRVDYDMYEKLIEDQIAGGTDALVVAATTGEGSTLSHEEHVEVVSFAVKTAAGRVPVIAGTGSNDTNYAILLSNECEKVGVDGLLMVTPYYNKTSQEGLIEHYNYIAQRVSAPIILYNVPSRTGMTIQPETYRELSRIENIVGTKEATGNISLISKTAALCGDDLAIYSGNDDQILPLMSLGGKGVISVLAHVVPKVAHDIPALYLAGDVEGSRKLQMEYFDLCEALFYDVNPIPVKEAMNMMGWNLGRCRLPLTRMPEAKREKLRAVMEKHGLTA